MIKKKICFIFTNAMKGKLKPVLRYLREAWLEWRQWLVQSLGAAPDPGMTSLQVEKGSSSGLQASPSVVCRVPSVVRRSVITGQNIK